MSNCFNCGKKGHIRSECPLGANLKKCYDCHENVADIKAHHTVCPKSRREKSIVRDNSKINNTIPKKEKYHNEISTDFYFLIDVSASMSGNRLQSAKNCAMSIVDCMNKSDRIAIVTFDTDAFFKLKPRPVEQILRQKELPTILDKIFAKGLTALYDAIYISVSQLRDKNQRTIIFVLTDGEDNSSKKKYDEIVELVKQYPNIVINIIHIDGSLQLNLNYRDLCQNNRGEYLVIPEQDIEITVKSVFNSSYHLNNKNDDLD